jgi:hypothetical protein
MPMAGEPDGKRVALLLEAHATALKKLTSSASYVIHTTLYSLHSSPEKPTFHLMKQVHGVVVRAAFVVPFRAHAVCGLCGCGWPWYGWLACAAARPCTHSLSG